MFRPISRLLMACLAASCVFACSTVAPESQDTPSVSKFEKIAVIILAGQDQPTPGEPAPPSAEEVGAGIATLEEMLQEHYANQSKISVFTAGQTEALLTENLSDPAGTARKIGVSTTSDGVLIMHVFRFQQRVTAKNQPASVAFDFRLYAANTGRAACSGRFDETQQPLTENLFKIGAWFKRGNKWISAEELTREGIEKMLNDCPSLTP